MAYGSSNPEDLAKNFTKDLYSGDTKSVMSYIDLSEAKSDEEKTFVNDKITQVVAENAAKAKRMGGVKDIQIEEKTINKDSAKIRVLVLFNNDNNQSSNVFLAKKDRKWLVLLK
ncbi:DUF4878 domain-containing protein [Campylobacter jejuni]|uniref:DUF4878 domain-containing protein n=1 Tax=Campylobacter jejuni TaxID=197 RepID=UPI0011207811|nr:DUF4878 domain-containing protein [Campylobacter jejuni]EAK8051830.1 DUF4878 domain-containing protein [Campylobacter jejuni]ECL3269034.1 DUF4878 domain-containing protein [Campylobacter jejuni]HEC2637162.1 DUF4878 domain-containing protein [Campylobacter jejuni]HEC2688781.1 DUF4878 domain-containing protein [Campylobacter jejuni]HED8708370.1 DUF4878 domain-containing protein [Campylobacter jejuni]